MSVFVIDTFTKYPEDISILLDANLGTLGVFIATYHNQFDEGRWKAILALVRERTIKLIRERLDCIEELKIFTREVIESGVDDVIKEHHSNVVTSLLEIVELLLANSESPDALAVIKRYNPLSWSLLTMLHKAVGEDGWYSMNDLAKRFSNNKDALKCLRELEHIHLVVMTTVFENSELYKCKICSRISEYSTVGGSYCYRCDRYSLEEVKGNKLSILRKSALISLTEAGHALMRQAKQETFYC